LGPEEVDVRGELPRTAKGEWKARVKDAEVRLAERRAVLAREDMLETSRGFRLERMGSYICVIGGNIGVFSTLTIIHFQIGKLSHSNAASAFRLCCSVSPTLSLSLTDTSHRLKHQNPLIAFPTTQVPQ